MALKKEVVKENWIWHRRQNHSTRILKWWHANYFGWWPSTQLELAWERENCYQHQSMRKIQRAKNEFHMNCQNVSLPFWSMRSIVEEKMLFTEQGRG